MELKVWVEGIQRVICGVTDDTTCQDIVVALAHATGTTGRFTLVERWKDAERLLTPSEHPLLSLHKWGEYASDVQFILRRTRSKVDKRNGQFNQHNFSPHFPELPQSSGSGSNIKKSLTFSGAHSSAKSRRLDKRNGPENSSGESQRDLSSLTSLSSKSSSPCSSLEKRMMSIPSNVHNVNLSSSPRSSPNRTFKSTISSPTVSPLSEETLVRTTPVGSPQKSNTAPNLASPRSSQSRIPDVHKNGSKSTPPREASSSILHNSSPSLFQKSHLEEYDLERHLRPASDPDLSKVKGTKVNGVKDLPEKVIEGTDKESLLKLIKEQQEKLESQESEIKSIDSEIRCWEDKENDYVQKSENIKSEVSKLQQLEVQLNLELRDLQILESSFESEKTTEQKLRSEISVAKSRLSHCEKKLSEISKKERDTLNELEKLRKEREREVQEAKDKEISMLQEISKLQKEVNVKLKEHEAQQESLLDLSSKVNDLEGEARQKESQIAFLEKELTETNLTEFMVLPADAVKEACESKRDQRVPAGAVLPIETRKCSQTDPPKSPAGHGGYTQQPTWPVGVNNIAEKPPQIPSRERSSSVGNVPSMATNTGEGDEVSLRYEPRNEQIFSPHKQVGIIKNRKTMSGSSIMTNKPTSKVPNMINGHHDTTQDSIPFLLQGRKVDAKPQFLYYL